jgi:hypothetical protein
MTLTALGPSLATAAFLIYMLTTLVLGGKGDWRMTAALSAAFLAFSIVTVVQEGPTGFWDVHTISLWGNQVWFDLLLSVAIGWTLLLPRLRSQGMRALPWLALIVATASIGLLACLSRIQWLEARR